MRQPVLGFKPDSIPACMPPPWVSKPTDKLIWDHGRRDGWTLLTKDTDFFERLALEGPPPKVIWLRTGNLRRADLETMLPSRAI